MQNTEQKRYTRTTALVLCGVFAALMAVCSFITIPLGFTPIPVNLATLGVFLTGGILGKKYGSISLIVYILLGAVGVPVFAGFKGGLGVLAGPTGGYIIGYLAAAFLTGLLVEIVFTKTGAVAGKNNGGKNAVSENGLEGNSRAENDSVREKGTSAENGVGAEPIVQNKNSRTAKSRTLRFIGIILSMIIGLAACYALGTAWFMISTGTGFGAAMISCVIPFLPGDAAKIIVGALLVQKLRPVIPIR